MAGNKGVIDADKDVVEGREPPSARVALSRERILAEAVAFIDEEGLAGLSMRRLGQRLGVEAMALYHHVQGRELLLDGVVELVIDEMKIDDDVLDEPRDGWQDFLLRLAHGVRRVAIAHPKVFPLVASRPAEAPWIRPPLRSLYWVETFLSGLRSEGFSDEAAVQAYRAYTSFLLGHLLLEVSTKGADLGPLDVLEEESYEGDDELLKPYPCVRLMRTALSQDEVVVEFEVGLEELLDRITRIRAEDPDSGS